MLVSSALRALCRRRCGFDPAGLSQAQIRDRLPRIAAAVEAERQCVFRQVVEVSKSAVIMSGFNRVIPNEGITRAEHLDAVASPVDADPNAVLESIIPWESSL